MEGQEKDDQKKPASQEMDYIFKPEMIPPSRQYYYQVGYDYIDTVQCHYCL